MFTRLMLSAFFSASVFSSSCLAMGEFINYEELRGIISQLETQKVYPVGELDAIFTQVERDARVLPSISKPAESTLEWKDYRPIFLTSERIAGGIDFWKKYQTDLIRAEKEYGVPAEMIVAIIGVETKYGRSMGKNRIIDSLSTLAFDYPPRAPFFRKELIEFLTLCKTQKLDALNLWGSYAGAMGYPQFMPSSWKNLAVDFDGDGRIDLFNSPIDAIGSVANYFQKNGWQSNNPVIFKAQITSQNYDSVINNKDLKTTNTLDEIIKKGLLPNNTVPLPATLAANTIRLQGSNGGEFWIAFDNFYVITKYNRSILYAMAAYQLSQSLREEKIKQGF